MPRNFHATSLVVALATLFALPGVAIAGKIIVDTTLDVDAIDGSCSLREAILSANDDVAHGDCPAGNGPDRIEFVLPEPATIILEDHLPTITASLAIRGPGTLELEVDGGSLYRPIELDSLPENAWLLVEELTLSNSRTPLGSAFGGAARIARNETAIFRRVDFIGNHAESGGGGIVAEIGSHVTVHECYFSGNIAEGVSGGGAIFADGVTTEIEVSRSAFVQNQAEAENAPGGGIRIQGAQFKLKASTLVANVAGGSGGGIRIAPDPGSQIDGTIEDSTIAGNVGVADLVGVGAGGIAIADSTTGFVSLSLRNTVVADNLMMGSPDTPDMRCGVSLVSLSTVTDFIAINEGCESFFAPGSPNALGNYVGTAAVPLNARLLPMGDFGGPTPVSPPSLGPGPPSPLIDKGSCPLSAADQRGYRGVTTSRRPVDLPNVPNGAGGDACDIGAFEIFAALRLDPLIFADGFEDGHTLWWTLEEP